MKRWITLLLSVLMVLSLLCLPASLGGIKEADATSASTAKTYYWYQGDSTWKNKYSSLAWNKACVVVSIAVQIARTDLVRVDESATTFDTSTKEGFNPATFAKVAVSKGAVTASSASVSWAKIKNAVPGFNHTTDSKYYTASTSFSYYPAKSKQNIIDSMKYFLSKGYYPIIEGPGSSYKTDGGRHYVAVVKVTDTDVRVVDPAYSSKTERSLFSVSPGGNTWTYSMIEKCGNPSGYGCCVLYKVDSTYLLPSSNPSVTITFDLNDDRGICLAETITVTTGSTYGTLPSPTRSGYAFLGWYDAASGGNAVTSSTTVTKTSNHTLYAHWTNDYMAQCTEYPTYGVVKVTKQSELKSLPCTKSLRADSVYYDTITVGTELTAIAIYKNTAGNYWYKVKYNGKEYYFHAGNAKWDHWLGSDITIKNPTDPSSITKGNGFHIKGTVTATYNRIIAIKAYIYSGTATSGTAAVSSSVTGLNTRSYSIYNTTLDNQLTFGSLGVGNYNYVLKADCTYSYSDDGSTLTTRQTGAPYLFHSAAFTVVTSGTTTYTVSFNPQGGAVSPTSITVKAGETVSLPTPNLDGFGFQGWYTEASGGMMVGYIGESYKPSGNTTLYAHWAARSYTLYFNANGGSCGMASKSVTYGGTYDDLPTPTWAGHSFDGWYTASSGGSRVYSSTTVTTAANHTLYAHWTEITVTSGQCGNNLYWSFDSSTGKLTITGSGAMYNYEWHDESPSTPWYPVCDQINSVSLPNGMTTIGQYAFYNCIYLSSINLPNSLTEIAPGAFEGCLRLNTINFPNGVTSIGMYAFYNCAQLKSVIMPNTVTYLGRSAFENCSGLTSLVISNKIDYLGYSVFDSCTSLTSVSIPNSVTGLEDCAFYGCTGLTSIILPNSVKYINSYVFTKCPMLADVYYLGTIEQLEQVYLDEYNDGLFSAEWHFGLTGWQQQNGKWYYYNADGAKATGWKADGGKWYYLDPADGHMTNGWQKIDGKWYYLNPGDNGYMVTGWKQIGTKWYYLLPGEGYMANGWQKVDGKWYYLNPGDDGFMVTGWKAIGGKWYYLKPGAGYMTNGWQLIDGKWYYLNPGDNGFMVTGWKKLGTKWYYLKPGDGWMVNGWTKVGTKWYYLNPGDDGFMVTGWRKVGNKWYYLNPGDDGFMVTGWKKVGNKWYYLNPGDDGFMVTGWKQIGGYWYYLNPGDDGYMVTGWKAVDGYWYYLDPNNDSRMATGWKAIGGQWYYFQNNGIMVTGTRTIDGVSYTFANNGVCQNP